MRIGIFSREATSATPKPAASRAARRRAPQPLAAWFWLGGVIDCYPRMEPTPIAGIPPANVEHNERRRPCRQVFLRSVTQVLARLASPVQPPGAAAKTHGHPCSARSGTG